MRTATRSDALMGVVVVAGTLVCAPSAAQPRPAPEPSPNEAHHPGTNTERRATQPPAVEARQIEDALQTGQSDARTHRLLERLGELERRSSIPVLQLYTQHRRPHVRQRAYLALSRIEHPTRSERLARGLRDADTRVRAAVARALGRIGAEDAVPLLLLALERGVEAAAGPIGMLGNDATVSRYGEHLGEQPLSSMLDGYAAYLERDDIALETKLSIVARLGEVASGEVRQRLLRTLRSLPTSASPRLRRALQNTARRIAVEASESSP